MAMIVPAPASPAPWIAFSPTAPQPITATEAPGCTGATRVAAPTPVITPQPIRQARSNGISRGTRIAPECGTTAYWACEETTEKWWSGAAAQLNRERPSSRCPRGWWRVKGSHRIGWSRSQ